MSFFLTLAVYIALFALQEYLRPKPKIESARPATLGQFDFPTATEDRPIPIVWGTVSLDGPNVGWYGDLRQVPISEKVKTGLWSSTRVTRGFKYYVGIQFGLCRGPIDSLRRVWIGDTEVFNGSVASGVFTIDKPELFGGDTLGSGGVQADCILYAGTQTQLADTYLSSFQSVSGVTPRYLGDCYVVFQKYQDVGQTLVGPGYIGNATSIKPWRFEVRRIPNPLGLATPALNGGNDCNLVTIVYELLTNSEWGEGIPLANIDTANFVSVGATLAAEGNGASLKLQAPIDKRDLLREIEAQMDGVVRLNPETGLFEIKLIRFDYNPLTIPHARCEADGATPANATEIGDPVRATWEETTNFVEVPYESRALDYKGTSAIAMDMANQRMQGRVVKARRSYPGVTDPALANSLAWRDLRTLAYPLLKLTLSTKRDLSRLLPGDVLALTSARLGLVRQPMRIINVDVGELTKGTVKFALVQDVFYAAAGGFGTSPGTGWTPPSDTLAAFAKTAVFEAPRAFLTRDPVAPGSYAARVWASGEKQGNEAGFYLYYDTTATPAYTLGGTSLGMMRVATLASAFARGTSPATSLTITATTALEKADILAAISTTATAAEIGQDLVHLARIGDEFVAFLSATSGSGNSIVLNTVYRGMLDTVQQDHSNGADIQLLFLGGGLTDTTFGDGVAVDVKLRPFSRSNVVAEGSVTPVSLTIGSRALRPYPPARITIGSAYPTTVSLEAVGSGDSLGFDVVLTRRDFRTVDEVVALTTDAAVLFADYPTANTSEHQIEIRNDPAGANTLLVTLAWATGTTFSALRRRILRATDGVLPTTLGVVVLARHTVDGSVRTSRSNLLWSFSVTTTLTGQFNFGALDQNEVSALYTATVNGTYSFTLGTSTAGGDVEYRLNAGAWTQLIAAGNTSGSIVGVVATDTIEIRHTSGSAGFESFLSMDAPGAGQDGYAILYKP